MDIAHQVNYRIIYSFRDELSERLAITREYGDFEKAYLEVLDNHAPIKNKTIRANHVPYMSKALRKAITRRSNLENKYLNNRTPENKLLYRRQKNYCSRLYKKERKMYYANLNLTKIKDVENIKTFFDGQMCKYSKNYSHRKSVSSIPIRNFTQ